MKSLKESLLSDIEDTLNSGDANIDARCRLNWRMTHYVTKNSKMVPGGRSKVIKKYFGNKFDPVEVSLYVPFAKDPKMAKRSLRKFDNVSTWFESIILNTKYDEPIDDVLTRTVIYPYKPIDDKLEYEFNSRLLPEYKKLYEEGKPIIRTLTRWMHKPYRTYVIIAIYLTSNVLNVDMDADYGKICEIEFLYYDKDKKSV